MASNDLGIRFTENKYATRNEVRVELQTPLVDTFWRIVTEYRQQFSHLVSLQSIDRNPFYYCECNSLKEKNMTLENDYRRFEEKMNNIDKYSSSYKQFSKRQKIDILSHIAKMENLPSDNNFLRMVVDGSLKSGDPKNALLTRYLDALEAASNEKILFFGLDNLVTSYKALLGDEEIINLYRSNDDSKNKTVIDRVYTSAPHTKIEGMMDSLFAFIQNASFSSFIKASIAFYFVNYIKPFDKYNEEMATIIAKLVLSMDGNKNAFLFPFEAIYSIPSNEFNKVMNEVSKTFDLTYVIMKVIDSLLIQVKESLDLFVNINVSEIKEEYEQSKVETTNEPIKEEPKFDIKDEPVEVIQPIKVDLPNNEVKEEIINEVKEEENKIAEPVVSSNEEIHIVEIKEEPKIELKEVIVEETKNIELVESKVVKPVVKKEEKKQNVETKLAFNTVLSKVDEREATALEEHLLELDPCLKKGQARFYARHCTMGKRYTIQQYKKYIGCVYETARTSMDSLVELGYYRQEMVKNKKVYTPIDLTVK